MTALIREPRPDDVETLAVLHVSTWQETYADTLPAEFSTDEVVQQRREMWARITAEPRPDRVVRVAEIDGLVVGFAAAGPPHADEVDPPRPLLLAMIYLAAAHHGLGLGQALLDAVVGDRPAYLWVAKGNDRAQAFYRRNGFTLDGTELPDPRVPAFHDLRMVR